MRQRDLTGQAVRPSVQAAVAGVKGMTMHRALFFVFFALLLSGCVGMAVGTYGKKELARSDFGLAKERNQFSFEKSDMPYTESEITEYWGEPDAVGDFGECKVLTYTDGISWVGAGALVGILPVPLVVPAGKYENRFYLHRSTAVGLVQEYGEVDRVVGYICGSNDCKAGFGGKVNESNAKGKDAVAGWCAGSL